LIPAVIPHECQHAINYNYHVIVNRGGAEESWLNEALSHFTEDYVGFGMENPSRVETFLEGTNVVSLVGATDLAGRGASYLFMRFMYEQSPAGISFARSLIQSADTGVDNIEEAFAGTETDFDQFAEYIRRWAIAVALTDASITSDSRYVYRSRTWNSDTSHWQGVCLRCDAEDGRGTVLSGPSMYAYTSGESISISGTAEAYIYIDTAPSGTRTITWSASASPQAVLIRIE
jgi:hypothetical protein